MARLRATAVAALVAAAVGVAAATVPAPVAAAAVAGAGVVGPLPEVAPAAADVTPFAAAAAFDDIAGDVDAAVEAAGWEGEEGEEEGEEQGTPLDAVLRASYRRRRTCIVKVRQVVVAPLWRSNNRVLAVIRKVTKAVVKKRGRLGRRFTMTKVWACVKRWGGGKRRRRYQCVRVWNPRKACKNKRGGRNAAVCARKVRQVKRPSPPVRVWAERGKRCEEEPMPSPDA